MIKKMIVLPGGSVAAERAFFARSVWARTLGMIGRRFKTAPFEAMVFENCSAVHCCWMIEKIDVIFVSEEFEVVKVCANVRPWSVVCGGKGCNVCKNSGYIEIAGAGMVDPNVLKNVGYDPEVWSGYAFGLGLERLAMLRYRIPDLRFLYDNDIRFLEQF